jgi:hypothetical protein
MPKMRLRSDDDRTRVISAVTQTASEISDALR